MSYFKSIEKAFDRNGSGGGRDPNLLINSTKAESERVLVSIRKWAKSKGYGYHRYLQSAMFHISFYTGKDHFDYKAKQISIDGWHGGGKGNRNYGNTFVIFTIYGKSHTQHFDLFKSSEAVSDDGYESYFKSQADKTMYLHNLRKMEQAILSGKIDTLWK